MKRLFLIIAAVSLAAGFVFAEGTIVETKTTIGTPNKYVLAWTASTNGIVSAATTFYVRGEIERVVSTATSTGAVYTITIKDAQEVDVLAGQGVAVATNAALSVVPGIKITDGTTTNVVTIAVNDLLTVSVTGVGSLRTGTVTLYVKED